MNEIEINEELVEEITHRIINYYDLLSGREKPPRRCQPAPFDVVATMLITRILSAVRDNKQKIPGEGSRRWKWSELASKEMDDWISEMISECGDDVIFIALRREEEGK